MYHNATIETIGRSIGLAAPERAIGTLDSVSDISPSVTYREDSALGNSRNVVSPPESVLVGSFNPLSSTMNKNEANISQGSRDSAISNSPPLKEMPEKTLASVLSISEMYEMLLHSRVSSFSKRPVWPSSADQELLDARFQIENTTIIRDHPGLYGPIYRNLSAFVRSYELMEQKLKRNSKYCICAKGYEVNSPRVVEAIIHGYVPVIISDNYVPSFFEILKWDSFAVFVFEKDIPDLKNILLSITEKRYIVMQQRVNQVKKHFLWHNSPVKYDIFHMILHSLWYNRVFRIPPH